MKFQDLKTKTKIVLAICPPMVLVLILAGVVVNSIGSIAEIDEAVDHPHEVLSEAAAIIRSAVDMETGMRGYLLAGQERFLAPYYAGEKRTYVGIAALQKTVNDNPKQVERLDKVWAILKEWQKNVTEITIDLRRDIGDAKTMNDMAQLVGEASGKVYFDRFRGQIATFIEQELMLLKIRRIQSVNARELVDKNFEKVDQTAAWVNHTLEVLAAADGLLSAAVDMETGMRGYLLTGEEEFLVPYRDGKQNFFMTLIKLNQMVSDNSAQVVRLKETKQIIQNWIDQVSEPNILERREIQTGGRSLDDIGDLMARKTGKTFFDAFRMQIAAFKEVELTLIGQRRFEALAAKRLANDNLEIMAENEAWVSHTNQVIRNANTILMAAVDMETGMRGYLLAGKEDFLEPYKNGVTKFYGRIDNLINLVRDNPDQVQLLKKSEETITSWQKDVTEPAIKLRRAIGNAKTMDDMADLIGEARGKRYFDQFRNVMAAFEKEERNLKEVRQIANLNTIDTTYRVIGAFTIIVLTIGGLSTWLIGNNIAGPLVITTKAIQRLANGDTSTRIGDTGRRDELGILTMAFNSMADQLNEKDNRVEQENNIRIQAEEALRDSELQKRQHLLQLDQVLRTTTVSVMAAALSHQLNQPLGSIVNFGRGSLRRLESNTSSQSNLRHTFEQICNEAVSYSPIVGQVWL